MVRKSQQPERNRGNTNYRIFAELGLLCTLAFHGLLYYGFRLRPPQEKMVSTVTESRCIFVGTAENQKPMPWEQNLLTWATLMDPTAVAKDDEQRGFSRARRLPTSPPLTPFPTYAFDLLLATEKAQIPLVLSRPLPPLAETFRKNWTLSLPPLPQAPEVPTFPIGIIWRTTHGEMITDGPQIPLTALQQSLHGKEVPQRPTRVEIIRDAEQKYSRLRLRKSCGNAGLDKIVIKSLRKELFSLELGEKYHGQSVKRSYWPALGSRRSVEVDWSMLPKTIASP